MTHVVYAMTLVQGSHPYQRCSVLLKELIESKIISTLHGLVVEPSRVTNSWRRGSSWQWSRSTVHCKGWCNICSGHAMHPLVSPVIEAVQTNIDLWSGSVLAVML